MKPPICCICDKHFDINEGGLVQFKMTENDKLQAERLKQDGFIGHPPAKKWFCSDHIELAKKYSHLTFSEAVKFIY